MKINYKIRKFKCLGCGKKIELRRAKDNLKYCSLNCYRKSARPQRKTGKVVRCEMCGKETYKNKGWFEKSKNHFCSKVCANKYQTKDKLKFTCKICGKVFYWSKSRVKTNNPLYCSWICRLKDKEHIIKNAIKGNLIQQNKKGLNRLEIKGRKMLILMGIDFEEQVLIFNKFLVDILIPNKNLIIQWDGEYWHNKPARKILDKSQDAYLRKCGYNVLRITDKQLKENKDRVYDNIQRAIQ
ncbi:MAG: DUF559 domain-containing protein [Nitrospira sp.]|nr:DUF559 domain-containing protein [Nitrospira sp.]